MSKQSGERSAIYFYQTLRTSREVPHGTARVHCSDAVGITIVLAIRRHKDLDAQESRGPKHGKQPSTPLPYDIEVQVLRAGNEKGNAVSKIKTKQILGGQAPSLMTDRYIVSDC